MTQEEEDVSFHIYIKKLVGKIQDEIVEFKFVSSSLLNDINTILNRLIRHLSKLAIYICQDRGKKIVQCHDVEIANNILLKHPNNMIIVNKRKTTYEKYTEFLKNKIANTFENLENFKPKGKKTSNMEKTQLKFSTTRIKQVMEQVKIQGMKYSSESIICLTVIVQTYMAKFINDLLSLELLVKTKDPNAGKNIKKMNIAGIRTTLESIPFKDMNENHPNIYLCRFL